jgi:hypothetical protein
VLRPEDHPGLDDRERSSHVGGQQGTRSAPQADFGKWGPTPTRESRNTQSLEVRFRATLGADQEVEVTLV